MKNFLKIFLFILLFVTLRPSVFVKAGDLNSTRELLYALNAKWRSSSAYIDEKTLQDEMIGTHPPRVSESMINALSATPIADIVSALEKANGENDQRLSVNKEMAINIIKMKIIADHLQHKRSAAPHHPLEIIAGYTPNQLYDLVKNLPEPNEKSTLSSEFNFKDFLLGRELSHNNINKNDLYVFKIAYACWVMRMMDVKLVSEVMIRGNGEFSLLSAVGQDDVMRSLKGARFRHDQIAHLRREPGFESADPRFFEDLLTWRFSGEVWSRRPGSLITPGATYMLFIGSIFDLLFAEAPSLAEVALAVGSGTMASRMVSVAPGVPLAEGGTRRMLEGFLRAKYSYINGFAGSSNVEASYLMDIPALGSGGNHAAVGLFDALFGDEMDFHIAMMNVFDYRPLRFLPDTFNQLFGTRKVLRATRGEAGGVRSDSKIPGRTAEETLFDIKKIFENVGYESTLRPKIAPTDDLNPFSLENLIKAGAPVDSALAGGAMAYFPNMSPVMKAVGVIGPDGELYPISKTADPDKSHYPMWKMWGRKTVNGRYVGDAAVLLGKSLPEGYEPDLFRYMKDGDFVRELPSISAQRVTHDLELERMPPEARDLRAKPGVYPATYSEELQRIRADYVAVHDPSKRFRAAIYLGSFDGVHDSHLAVVDRAKELYGLDQLIIPPTGDVLLKSPDYQTKPTRLSALARVNLLRRKFKDRPWVTVYEGSAKSSQPLTAYETVEAIAKLLPENADIFVLVGQNLLAPMAHFKNAKELLQSYNVIFTERKFDDSQSPSAIKKPSDLTKLLGTNHITRDKDGNLLRTKKDRKSGRFNVVELQPLRTRADSSAELRSFYDNQKKLFTLHSLNRHNRSLLPQMDLTLGYSNQVPGIELSLGANDLASLAKTDPYKILPNFHMGWDLDGEMKALVLEEVREGFDVYVIVDSAAGHHARLSATALREMAQGGVKFVSTQEYFELVDFAKKGADWAQVLNYLAELKAKSLTQHLVLEELDNNFFWLSEGAGPCIVGLETLGKK